MIRGGRIRSIKKIAKQPAKTANPGFSVVVAAFAEDRQVSQGRKGFGSGALKVNGKIFAMMSSGGQFVVKLPVKRVDELVAAGHGERFEPRPGRAMREWFAVLDPQLDWIQLAQEACDYGKQ